MAALARLRMYACARKDGNLGTSATAACRFARKDVSTENAKLQILAVVKTGGQEKIAVDPV